MRDVSAAEIESLQAQSALAVPHYLQIELVSACRRLVISGLLDEADVLERLSGLDDLPIISFDTAGLKVVIMRMRNNFSAYDAGYVALAEILDLPLMTHDLRLKRAVAAHTAVRLI